MSKVCQTMGMGMPVVRQMRSVLCTKAVEPTRINQRAKQAGSLRSPEPEDAMVSDLEWYGMQYYAKYFAL